MLRSRENHPNCRAQHFKIFLGKNPPHPTIKHERPHHPDCREWQFSTRSGGAEKLKIISAGAQTSYQVRFLSQPRCKNNKKCVKNNEN